MGKTVTIPEELEARIAAKLDAFKGDKNDDTTHRRIVYAIEEELLAWQREHPRFVIPTPELFAWEKTIRVTYTEPGTKDETSPPAPPTIDEVRLGARVGALRGIFTIAPAPDFEPNRPPEPRVPSALIFAVCRGRALAIDWHGTDLRSWIENDGMRDTLREIDATARPDGVYVWRGRTRGAYYAHTGESDSWLDGKIEPLDDDALEMMEQETGDPFDHDEIAAHVEWSSAIAHEHVSDLDRVKEVLTDYAHSTGRRAQRVHEVVAACDQERREAIEARDRAVDELVEIRRRLSIPGGADTLGTVDRIIAGARRLRDEVRAMARGTAAPDDGGMTDTIDPDDDVHVKAKADEVLALLEREPASHMTTEILAREVRRLRRLEKVTEQEAARVATESRIDALGELYLDAPDDTDEERALDTAHSLVCERHGIDAEQHVETLSMRRAGAGA